jgi:hypothetical protein
MPGGNKLKMINSNNRRGTTASLNRLKRGLRKIFPTRMDSNKS